ncbi:twin-arginine translocase TatA/TatE family subunit [Nitrososphaera viennensis]|uniref:TatA subunit of twin-arginine targeting system n=2 Tax=Nitrososphaera viennensis TaxID=1034015 RepID=A0A060HQM0_9ARCH|nr:twin-arginine translocase TatA/TatE family subunit [Nitrososphaera viennensis]AIC15457.1 TatA subunit of twin-arginine targeting system [Nitrososphaera viennensis EN76]UVS70347.1 twin-arginine translocase TatA/TatE family subunit [Nitrososphaera viennensis]
MPFSGLLMMNIAGSEWIIIILVALILIFGAKRLPQVSRTFGKAVGEYEKARQQFRQEMQGAAEQARRDAGINKIPRITRPVATEREKLEMIAASLGIDFAGKSDEELKLLISQRMNV